MSYIEDWNEFFRLARLALRLDVKEPEFNDHVDRYERFRMFGWFSLKERFWSRPERPDQHGELTISWLDYKPGDPDDEATSAQRLARATEVLRKLLVLECLSDV
jgi:hypothetical protein